MNKKFFRRKTKIYLTAIAIVTIGIASAIILGAVSYTMSQNTLPAISDIDSDIDFEDILPDETNREEQEQDTGKIYDNIFINDIAVGGLSKLDAIAKIEKEIVEPTNERDIVLIYADKSWSINYKEIGALYNTYEMVDTAYKIGRTGTPNEQKDKIKDLSKTPERLDLKFIVNKETIESRILEIADEILVPATNPTVKRENSSWVTTGGKPGYELDTADAIEKVLNITKTASADTVNLVTKELSPNHSADEFNMMTNVLGSFKTNYNVNAGLRNTNLKVAAEKINGTALFPGEVFSTNRALGPSTYENGYVNAPVIVNGVLEDGIGGGVCQVSSTLYNAVLFSELQVVERQNHSLTVAYVPLGRDATLAGDYIDFKFKNSTNYPVYIESYLSGGQVVVNIYGHETRDPNRKLEFESITTGTIPPPAEKITESSSLPAGTRSVTSSAKSGTIVEVYKKVIVNGSVTERVKVNTSRYKATAAQVTVGTGTVNDSSEEIPEETPVETPPTDTVLEESTPVESTPTESIPDEPTPAEPVPVEPTPVDDPVQTSNEIQPEPEAQSEPEQELEVPTDIILQPQDSDLSIDDIILID